MARLRQLVSSGAGAMAACVLVLMLLGAATGRLSDPAWREVRVHEPALRVEDLESGAGQGLLLGVLGGFRALVADLLWLRADLTWEARDLPATEALIELVTSVDPRPLYFWINGARMIADDMPVWRVDALDGSRIVPEAVQQRIAAEQGRLAIDLLRRGLDHHPREPHLLFEIGNIARRRLGDPEMAADYYRQAAQQPGAPYYMARIYGETLRHLGRPREAYEWLRQLHPTLPPQVPQANAGLVLDRIRQLEDQLGIPADQRYVPPPAPPPTSIPGSRSGPGNGWPGS